MSGSFWEWCEVKYATKHSNGDKSVIKENWKCKNRKQRRQKGNSSTTKFNFRQQKNEGRIVCYNWTNRRWMEKEGKKEGKFHTRMEQSKNRLPRICKLFMFLNNSITRNSHFSFKRNKVEHTIHSCSASFCNFVGKDTFGLSEVCHVRVFLSLLLLVFFWLSSNGQKRLLTLNESRMKRKTFNKIWFQTFNHSCLRDLQPRACKLRPNKTCFITKDAQNRVFQRLFSSHYRGRTWKTEFLRFIQHASKQFLLLLKNVLLMSCESIFCSDPFCCWASQSSLLKYFLMSEMLCSGK